MKAAKNILKIKIKGVSFEEGMLSKMDDFYQ